MVEGKQYGGGYSVRYVTPSALRMHSISTVGYAVPGMQYSKGCAVQWRVCSTVRVYSMDLSHHQYGLQSVSWSLAEFRHNKIVQSPHENYFNICLQHKEK